jgi:hypothetical protein
MKWQDDTQAEEMDGQQYGTAFGMDGRAYRSTDCKMLQPEPPHGRDNADCSNAAFVRRQSNDGVLGF